MKIYVACLASYNNGILHGAWIDAESDVDAMQEQVNAMLRKSRFPNVFVICPDCIGAGVVCENGDECENCTGLGKIPSAEEWAIHDYDGLPASFGEYCGLQTIADFVELCDEYVFIDSADLAAIVADIGLEYTADKMLDDYCGCFDSFHEYAYDAADESLAAHGIKDDSPLARYFDYDAFARDLAFDMHVIDLPSGGVAVFYA